MISIILRAIGMGGNATTRSRAVLKGVDTASKGSKSKNVQEAFGKIKDYLPKAGLTRAGSILARSSLILELDALLSPLCGLMTLEERALTMANLVQELDEVTGDGTTAVESLVAMSTVGVVFGSGAISGRMRLVLDAAESVNIRGEKITTFSTRGMFTGFGSPTDRHDLSSLTVDADGKPVKFKSGVLSRGTKQLSKLGRSRVGQVVSIMMSTFLLLSSVLDDNDNSGRLAAEGDVAVSASPEKEKAVKDVNPKKESEGEGDPEEGEFVITQDSGDPGVTKEEQKAIFETAVAVGVLSKDEVSNATDVARSILDKAVREVSGDEPPLVDAGNTMSVTANAIVSKAMTSVFLGPVYGVEKLSNSYAYRFGRSPESITDFMLRISRDIASRSSGLVPSENGYADTYRSYIRDLANRQMLAYCTAVVSVVDGQSSPTTRAHISKVAASYDVLLAELSFPHISSSEAIGNISHAYEDLRVYVT